MSSDPSDLEPVVRARRIEIIDEHGRVRVIVGDVPAADPERPDFGVVVLDHMGRRRAWLALSHDGPLLAFDHDGNSAVEIGVNDSSSDAVRPGAYVVLSDSTGGLSVGWWVEEDGSVTMRTGGRDPF